MSGPSPAAVLAHDVGKYVARTARNLPDGPISRALVDMLVRDLFALPAGDRASAVFTRLAAALPSDERLERARAALAAIDALEPAIREGRPDEVRRAAALALDVETLLRAIARDGSAKLR